MQSNPAQGKNFLDGLMLKLSHRFLGNLFLITAIITIFMMQVGALTRLTGSGLSIPDWPLINGTLMYPTSDSDWLSLFNRYQEFPQFHLINSNMSVSEFKTIFFFEYFHRSITSLISIMLVLILFVMLIRREFWRTYKFYYLFIFALLFAQALAGYLMVKSGLEPGMAAVSPYRLMIHFSLACLFLAALFWTAWRVKSSNLKSNKNISPIFYIILLVSLQLVSGALMAGTKAGFLYSDWPLMNSEIIPSYLFSTEGKFAENIFLNFTENTANIHFFHRLIAYVLAGVISFFYIKNKRNSSYNSLFSFKILPYLLFCQILLGILAVTLYVPIAIGTIHQLGSILLFVCTINIHFRLRYHEQN